MKRRSLLHLFNGISLAGLLRFLRITPSRKAMLVKTREARFVGTGTVGRCENGGLICYGHQPNYKGHVDLISFDKDGFTLRIQ